jgi:hypothetical protein
MQSVVILSAIVFTVYTLVTVSLSVILLIVVMLNTISLSVILLSVVMLNVVMLCVVMPTDYSFVECQYAKCCSVECRYA